MAVAKHAVQPDEAVERLDARLGGEFCVHSEEYVRKLKQFRPAGDVLRDAELLVERHALFRCLVEAS